MTFTLALIAVVSAIGAPRVAESLSVYRVRAGARQVFADLQAARMAAVTENNRYRVSLVDAYRYRIHDDTDGDSTIDVGETVVQKDVREAGSALSVSLTAPVTFLGTGTALAAATFTVTGQGRTKTVTVTAMGRVRVD